MMNVLYLALRSVSTRHSRVCSRQLSTCHRLSSQAGSSRDSHTRLPPPPPVPKQGWKPTSVYDIELPGPFTTSFGETISRVSVRVEEHGLSSLPASRTIAIFPSFSHSSHVASNSDDPSPGWWQDMVGPGKGIDTRRWRVLCLSSLGSPFGPTSPLSICPETGRPYRASFPQVTPSDLARCHHAALRVLGILPPLPPSAPAAAAAAATVGSLRSLGTSPASGPPPTPTPPPPAAPAAPLPLHAIVGCSLGGMQALQFASLFPASAQRCIAIACTGKTTPFTVGVRSTQRRAILSDPAYRGGNYADAGGAGGGAPRAGLRAAREIGTLFYRSRAEFDARFDWAPHGDAHFTAPGTWEVESYLAYAGDKFSRAFDANSYLLLSKCMDLHDLGDGHEGRATYAEGAARIRARTLLVGFTHDALTPPAELRVLRDAMAASGGKVSYHESDSTYGHDAFLKEATWLGGLVRQHLEEGLERELADEEALNTGTNAP